VLIQRTRPAFAGLNLLDGNDQSGNPRVVLIPKRRFGLAVLLAVAEHDMISAGGQWSLGFG
jgi:hypothetical protein